MTLWLFGDRPGTTPEPAPTAMEGGVKLFIIAIVAGAVMTLAPLAANAHKLDDCLTASEPDACAHEHLLSAIKDSAFVLPGHTGDLGTTFRVLLALVNPGELPKNVTNGIVDLDEESFPALQVLAPAIYLRLRENNMLFHLIASGRDVSSVYQSSGMAGSYFLLHLAVIDDLARHCMQLSHSDHPYALVRRAEELADLFMNGKWLFQTDVRPEQCPE